MGSESCPGAPPVESHGSHLRSWHSKASLGSRGSERDSRVSSCEPESLEPPRAVLVNSIFSVNQIDLESRSDTSSSSSTRTDGLGVWPFFRNLLRCSLFLETAGELKWCCRPSLRCCFIFTCSLAVVLTGVLLGVYVEHWTVLTSVYVLMQVVTTIGYGDVTVSSEGMKLFMSFYVLCVLVMFSHLLTLFIQSWLNRHIHQMEDLFTGHRAARARNSHPDEQLAKSQWRKATLVAPSILLVGAIIAGTVFFATVEPCECSYGTGQAVGCDPTDLETCIETGGYQKTVIDAFYMSVITITTVGFGDHSPRSEEGRAFGIVWCIIGVGCCLNWLRAVTEFLIEKQRWQDFDYAHMQLNTSIFEEMDSEHTGYLTRHEYIRYALITHGLVSQGILDHLNRQFNDMDPRGTNHVSYKDLRARQMLKQEAEALRASSSSLSSSLCLGRFPQS